MLSLGFPIKFKTLYSCLPHGLDQACNYAIFCFGVYSREVIVSVLQCLINKTVLAVNKAFLS